MGFESHGDGRVREGKGRRTFFTRNYLSRLPVKRRKTAALGAVFGALSTAPKHVGLAALGSDAKL